MTRVELQPGNMYVLMDKRVDRAFSLYHLLRSSGREVMVVARMHPERLHKDFGIPPEAVSWLSNTQGPRIVNPQSVGLLTDTMVRVFEKGTGAAVIMEGVEYVMTQNDFTKVLKMTNFLYETVAVHQALLIITLDPQAFSEKELALMTREAVTISPEDEVGL